MTEIITHWHDQNPWKDDVIYVPLEELAACHISIGKPLGTIVTGPTTAVIMTYTMEHLLDYFREHGKKLDAYVINNDGLFAGGVRFGPEGSDYISGFSTPKLLNLVRKYRRYKRKSA